MRLTDEQKRNSEVKEFKCPQKARDGCDAPTLGRAGACLICQELWPKLQQSRALLYKLRSQFTADAIGHDLTNKIDEVLRSFS